jgi:hypothetical protein
MCDRGDAIGFCRVLPVIPISNKRWLPIMAIRLFLELFGTSRLVNT